MRFECSTKAITLWFHSISHHLGTYQVHSRRTGIFLRDFANVDPMDGHLHGYFRLINSSSRVLGDKHHWIFWRKMVWVLGSNIQ